MTSGELSFRARIKENLKTLREHYGYTQNQLAAALRCERSTYSYYETGKSTPPLYQIYLLCRIYKISVDDVFAKEISQGREKSGLVLSSSTQFIKKKEYLAVNVIINAMTKEQLRKLYKAALTLLYDEEA